MQASHATYKQTINAEESPKKYESVWQQKSMNAPRKKHNTTVQHNNEMQK